LNEKKHVKRNGCLLDESDVYPMTYSSFFVNIFFQLSRMTNILLQTYSSDLGVVYYY